MTKKNETNDQDKPQSKTRSDEGITQSENAASTDPTKGIEGADETVDETEEK